MKLVYLDTNIFVTFFLKRDGFDKLKDFMEKNKGEFDWGYKIDDNEIRLNDLAMLNSFIDIIKSYAVQDFNDRLDNLDELRKKINIQIESIESKLKREMRDVRNK